MTRDAASAEDEIRWLFRQRVDAYREAVNQAQAKLIAGLYAGPDLPEPMEGHRWVARYEVSQTFASQNEWTTPSEAITVKTMWEQEPIEPDEPWRTDG